MKYPKAISIILFLLLGFGSLHAQESPTATGGEAVSTDGTVSYSIGQVVHIQKTGSNGLATEGVEQPYEIFVVTDVKQVTLSAGSHTIDVQWRATGGTLTASWNGSGRQILIWE